LSAQVSDTHTHTHTHTQMTMQAVALLQSVECVST